jgi:hypothetical protein
MCHPGLQVRIALHLYGVAMKLPPKQAAVVRDAIDQWRTTGVISDAQAAALADTSEIQIFDWRRLAKYSFWVALFSIVSSVSAVLSDRVLTDVLAALFDAPRSPSARRSRSGRQVSMGGA